MACTLVFSFRIWDLALERDAEEEMEYQMEQAKEQAKLPDDIPPQLLFDHMVRTP